MDNVAANENYDVQNNGTFRTFSANSGGSSSAPNFSSTPNFSGSNTHSVSSPAPKAMRFNAKNMVAIKESEADTGDWKVYSTQVQDELFLINHLHVIKYVVHIVWNFQWQLNLHVHIE